MGSIYKITNNRNGKAYIGQTIHDAVNTRIRDHLAGKGNRILKQALAKYGADAFTFEILHDGIIPEFLNDLEKEAIAKFNTVTPHGYNLTAGGEDGVRSKEARLKISEAKKGQTPWNKGKPFSEETRRKISEALKGKPCKPQSEETRRKRSIAFTGEKNPRYGKPGTMKGRKHSLEARRRMSESTKGEKNPNFGKTHSAETRRRISEGNKGKKVSQSTRKKISEGLTGKYRNPHREKAEAFYFSLPAHLSSTEKRKIFREKFLNIVPERTIYMWVKEWQSEGT